MKNFITKFTLFSVLSLLTFSIFSCDPKLSYTIITKCFDGDPEEHASAAARTSIITDAPICFMKLADFLADDAATLAPTPKLEHILVTLPIAEVLTSHLIKMGFKDIVEETKLVETLDAKKITAEKVVFHANNAAHFCSTTGKPEARAILNR